MSPQVDLPAKCISLHVNLSEHVRRWPRRRYDDGAVSWRRDIFLATGVHRRCAALRSICCCVGGGACLVGYLHIGNDVAPGGMHRWPAYSRRQWDGTGITGDKKVLLH